MVFRSPSTQESQPRWNSSVFSNALYTILIVIVCSCMLIINKAAVLAFPYPSTVLLLQLATTAALAWVLSRWHGNDLGSQYQQKLGSILPSTASFFLVVYTSIQALHHVNVDTMLVLRACTPITVLLGNWLYMNTTLPVGRAWAPLAAITISASAASSMQLSTISSAGLIWLVAWSVAVTINIVYSSNQVQTLKSTALGYVFYENILSCVFCIPLALATDFMPALTHQQQQQQSQQQLAGVLISLPAPAATLVCLSCVMAFAISLCKWSMSISATRFSTTDYGALTKLMTVLLNASIWDNHGSTMSQVLLVLGIVAGDLYEQQCSSRSPSSSSNKAGSSQNKQSGRLSPSKDNDGSSKQQWPSLLGAIIGLAVLMWTGVVLGTALKGNSPAVISHAHVRPQKLWVEEMQQLRDAVWRGGVHYQPSSNSSNNHLFASSNSTSSSSSNTNSSSSSTIVPLQEDYMKRLKEAAAKPIKVAVMTSLFWQLDPRNTQNCSVDGVPLDCHFTRDASKETLDTADVLYYHAPSFGGNPRPKAFPEQLRLVMSLESAAYYDQLNRPDYMCRFDAEMTYRTCAQVTNWYSLEAFDKLFKTPVVPFEEKEHALAYVNSNCAAKSGRTSIMNAMIGRGSSAKVPVHSFGRCDNNKPFPGGSSKIDIFRKYKFCVSMENSLQHDYITEKIWDGLSAGCIPIYLGSRSVYDYIPDRRGIIMYDETGRGNASTPAELDALMHEIGSNKTRYEEMIAWKTRKVEDQPSPLFKYLWSIKHLTGECLLCQFVARHRTNPKPRYTTCLFNSTWMAAAEQTMQTDNCAADEKAALEQLQHSLQQTTTQQSQAPSSFPATR